jgi:murein L,D-transpeptidase YafK
MLKETRTANGWFSSPLLRYLLVGVAGFVLVLTTIFFMKSERKPLPELTEPKIIVKKSKRILELYSNDKLIRTYKIALGSNPNEDKKIEGDGATPLGEFYVFTKNNKSKFYLSLGLSYPNTEDAERGLREGLVTQEEHDAIIKAIVEKKMPPQNTKLGGEIYIHGGTTGTITDWTQGCVALNNEDIKELFDAVPVQTPVIIEP